MTTMDAVADVRVGHRELLATLREFAEDLDGPRAGPESGRGAVAFLRQTLLPFARHEESTRSAAGQCAALDHAFLTAEIDALAAEGRVLESARPEGVPAAVSAVRRRVHRLEAVLELHAARDDEWPEDAPRASRGRTRAAGRGGPREMGEHERDRFLAGRSWGVLSTVGADGSPYGVPVAYGWDGGAFFLATGPGRKLKNLEANGAACLTISDVVDGSRWRCVVATGSAVPLSGPAEATRGLARIARQQGTVSSAESLARALRGRLFRLVPAELNGRVRD